SKRDWIQTCALPIFRALAAQVRAFVVAAQVVDAEIVRGGHPAHVVPGPLEPDVAGGGADHEGDLALEGQQLRAGGALEGAAGAGHGAGGLEEVRGGGGAAAGNG